MFFSGGQDGIPYLATEQELSTLRSDGKAIALAEKQAALIQKDIGEINARMKSDLMRASQRDKSSEYMAGLRARYEARIAAKQEALRSAMGNVDRVTGRLQDSGVDVAAARDAAPKTRYSERAMSELPPLNAIGRPGAGPTGVRVSQDVVQTRSGDLVVDRRTGLRPGVYGPAQNPIIVQDGRGSTAAKVAALNKNNQSYNDPLYDARAAAVRSRDERRAANRPIGQRTDGSYIYQADFQDTKREMRQVNYINPGRNVPGNVRPNNTGRSGRDDWRAYTGPLPGGMVSSKAPSYGERIIRDSAKRQKESNQAINELLGYKTGGYDFSFQTVERVGKGVVGFVPKLTSSALGGVQALIGEVVLRGENLYRYGPLGGAAANRQRTAQYFQATPAVGGLIATGVVEQVKTPEGAGEIVGGVLSGRLLPGGKAPVIEEFRFAGAKTDVVGSFGKTGSAIRSTTIIAEKNILPFDKATFTKLKAAEPDFLVIRGNTRGVATTPYGTGALADINQPFLVRNPFLQRGGPEFNTVGVGTVPRNPNAGFGFPLRDAPVYPLRSAPRSLRVDTPSIGKKTVSQELFLQLSDKIARREAGIQRLARSRVVADDAPYLASDLLFEKFTPRTTASSSRTGAEFFNAQGVSRLPAPRVLRETPIRNVEAPIASIEGKNVVGRTVQERVRFDFDADVPPLRFFEEAAGKTATAFRRPRDTVPETVVVTGKTPKVADFTKRGDGTVDPAKSYFSVRVGKKNRFVEVVNPDYRSAVGTVAAKKARNAKILTESRGSLKPSSYASKSESTVLLQQLSMEKPSTIILEEVSTSQRPVVFVQRGVVRGAGSRSVFPAPVSPFARSAPVASRLSPVSVERSMFVSSSASRAAVSSRSSVRNTSVTESVSLNRQGSVQFNRQSNISRSTQVNVQRSVQRGAQRNIQRQVQSTSVTQGVLPLILRGESTEKRKSKKESRKSRVDELFAYTPSLAGTELGALGPSGSFRTGLTVRPVITPVAPKKKVGGR